IPAFTSDKWTHTNLTEVEEYSLYFPSGHTGNSIIFIDVEKQTNYTMTFNSDYARYYIYEVLEDNSLGNIIRVKTGSETYTFNTEDVNRIRVSLNTFSGNVQEEKNIWNLKLEKGTIPTDWSPAPEDYQNQIDKQDKILTKHETEIEQNKLGLNTKVGYTEMNGTNKTLEKLLTEFSQTADGFNFRIDSNGMIQDLTFDRNAFKLNSNLIEFNDGDVVIKDGVTTIKDAYIDKLFSKTAFIEQLKAVDIDFNRASAYGSNGSSYLKIVSDKIELAGIYDRTW